MRQAKHIQVEQGSLEWHQLRATRITASRMFQVINMSKAYAEQIAGAILETEFTDFDAPAMKWGRDNEPRAAASYEMRMNVDVEFVGFFIHPEFDFVGGSPDPLVGDDGMTEIKCPFNPTNHIFAMTSDRVPDEHIPQIQSNLWITGREWCDFVSFDPREASPRDLYIKRVFPDPIYHQMLERRCVTFWQRLVMQSKPMPADILDLDIPDLF